MSTKKKSTHAIRSGNGRNGRAKNVRTEKPVPTPPPLPALPPALPATPDTAASLLLPIDAIEISPLNYRKYYDPAAMAEFAAGIRSLGFIISPVTVREISPDQYQLVVGERRYHGALLAGLSALPAVIRDLTDEQVEEIQLQENVQREDPHPLHEAIAVQRMYSRGLSTEEIHLRLGKSISWVYQREKLAALIPDIQEMFLANIFSLTQVLEIADLAPEAQTSFFDNHCTAWKQQTLSLPKIAGLLNSYRYELSHAHFDITDPLLLPEAGPCTGCRFNTAYQGLLLPDNTTTGRCTKKNCFDTKRKAHLQRTIEQAFSTGQAVAVIAYGELPADIRSIIDPLNRSGDIPVYQQEKVTLVLPPTAPSAEDFKFYDFPESYYEESEEEGNSDDGVWEQVEQFDEQGFAQAQAEYATELDAYNNDVSNNKCLKGLYVKNNDVSIVSYIPVPSVRQPKKGAESPSVNIDALIKARQDTVDTLEQALTQLAKKETRNKELDQEKIQKKVHSDLVAANDADDAVLSPTEADRIATLYLLYQGLTYRNKREVEQRLNLHFDHKTKPETAYQALAALAPSQATYLTRAVLSGLSDSQMPASVAGYCLRKVAEDAGVDTVIIEKKQLEIAKDRQDRLSSRVALYKKRLKKRKEEARQAGKRKASGSDDSRPTSDESKED